MLAKKTRDGQILSSDVDFIGYVLDACDLVVLQDTYVEVIDQSTNGKASTYGRSLAKA